MEVAMLLGLAALGYTLATQPEKKVDGERVRKIAKDCERARAFARAGEQARELTARHLFKTQT